MASAAAYINTIFIGLWNKLNTVNKIKPVLRAFCSQAVRLLVLVSLSP